MSTDRVALVTSPALPARCVICNFSANGRRRFLDFNVSIDYYGAILICEDCLLENANLLDGPVAAAKRQVEEMQEKLEEVTNELDRYKFVVSSLSFVRPDFGLLESAKLKDSEQELTEASGNTPEQVAIGGLTDFFEPTD